ncbi:MAG: hypothetical protein WKG07_50340 [Hymenobacter sp.]
MRPCRRAGAVNGLRLKRRRRRPKADAGGNNGKAAAPTLPANPDQVMISPAQEKAARHHVRHLRAAEHDHRSAGRRPRWRRRPATAFRSPPSWAATCKRWTCCPASTCGPAKR